MEGAHFDSSDEPQRRAGDAAVATPFAFRCGTARDQQAWMVALLAGVVLGVTDGTEWTGLKVSTTWGGPLAQPAQADPAKHGAYIAQVLRACSDRMPWLVHLLQAASADLIVAPGVCLFTVPAFPTEVHRIDELVPLTWLVPWTEASDQRITTH